MDKIDLQVIKEAVEVLNEHEGEVIEDAKRALAMVIAIWDQTDYLPFYGEKI